MSGVLTYLVPAVAAAGFTAALTPLAIWFGQHTGIIDLPGARKIHDKPITRCGGIAIAGGTLLAAALSVAVLRPSSFSSIQLLVFWISAASVFVMGLADDLCNIPSKFKLLGLVAASFALCSSGVRLHNLSINSHTILDFGWASWPITLLWLVSVTVSINFIDGLDGLAAGIVGMAALVVVVGAVSVSAMATAITALALAGSCIGFLFFNFNPARVFMGDSGSMFIGFTLAALGVLCAGETGRTTGVLLPAIALAVPLLDTLLTMVRRTVLQRRSIFAAERGHVHHRLLDIGLEHRHAVLLLYAVTLVASVVALLVHFGMGWAKLGALALLAPVLLGLFSAAGSIRGRETLDAVRRNRRIGRERGQAKTAFDEAYLRFRQVLTFDDWWRETCNAADTFGLSGLTLPLTNRDGSRKELRWTRTGENPSAGNDELLRANLPIAQRRGSEPLRLQADVAVDTFLESAAQRLTLFTKLMGTFSAATLPADVATVGSEPEHDSEDGMTLDSDLRLPDEQPGALGSRFGSSKVRIAIVHDFLYTYAGAERVLEQMVKLFPGADLFSLFDFLSEDQRHFVDGKKAKTSFLQRMPLARRNHRILLPLMPLAIEQLDVSSYDIIISSSYLAAKGVITRPDQLHICYCHSPVRFAWDLQTQYLGRSGLVAGVKSFAARALLHYIRMWDVRTSNGVDLFLCNSQFVGRRIEKCYRRSSQVVYPPVNINRLPVCSEKQDFYLTASRLVQYKRIDLIIEAFNRTPSRTLVVIGDGPDLAKLRAMAGPNVRVLGHQPFARLRYYMQHAKAFVFAAEEDFGIAPVEAQACGTPVIAYGRGGVTESVIDNVTGLFFNEQTADAIQQAVDRFESMDEPLDADVIRCNAERFSNAAFREELGNLVRQTWIRFKAEQIGRGGRTFPATAPTGVADIDLKPQSAQRPAFSEPPRGGAGRPIRNFLIHP